MLVAEKNISSVISTDIRIAREAGTTILGGVPREFLQIAMMSITLILLSSRLFIVFIFGIVPLILLLRWLGNKLKKRYETSLTNYAKMIEWLQQRFLGIETIKHYRTESIEKKKYLALAKIQFRSFFRAAKVHASIPQIMESFTVIAFAAALYYALWGMKNESLPLLLSFFSTLALLAQSTSRIGRFFNQSREGSAALQRVFTLKTELAGGNRARPKMLSVVRGAETMLVCENISVVYDRPVFTNFSYRFTAGRMYGIHGKVGAGKSTLMKAILGIVPLSAGKIFLQTKKNNEKKIPLYLPQKYYLFAGSIAENICYPDSTPVASRVYDVLSRAQFPIERQERVVDYETSELSGGQEQRIGIARLFYHSTPLILIDEGTSALDQRTEDRVLCEIKKLVCNGDVIVIMIAHRQSALEKCDVLVEVPP